MNNKKTISSLKKEFNLLIEFLYANNLCIGHFDYAINSIGGNKMEITRPNRKNESNILYDEIVNVKNVIKELLERKEFNILLRDRSIIQFEFICENNIIINERFIYIRAFDNIDFIEEEYDDFDWFDIDKGIPLIFRVDYNEIEQPNHPRAHATLNNIECCRIPMKGPISLTEFMTFILKNFYDIEYNGEIFKYANIETITAEESKHIHFNWNN